MRRAWMRAAVVAVFLLALGCVTASGFAQGTGERQVLFVCEHGNVKSLMAASYFNQSIREFNLPYRAVARGSAPDSTTVPAAIVQGLEHDGIDVSTFQPMKVSASDIASPVHIVLIGTSLPAGLRASSKARIELWNDVPPASMDFEAARASLRKHVRELIAKLPRR
jgi:protein-tyrosine-phosphatase